MADSSPLAHSPTLAVPTEPRTSGSDDRLAPGAAVGEYIVDRFIGAGAMGEVYAGKHPVIGKRVAIKVLRHELAASAEAAERFIREARAVNQIDHENVVDVFAFGRLDDGRLYLVMDLVEGRSLRAHLVDGPLELGAALQILETIAEALDAAHARGVVHRDLKPDNIVLSNATPPKVFVLDFGIAKLISKVNETGSGPVSAKSGPGTLTGAGTWLGTPGYMAPEQWSVDGAGPASDRYSLGVIAFELLAGALPFSASSVPAMMEQHFRAEIPTLSSRGAVGMPNAIDSVLRKALAKDPDQRFSTARDFVTALRDAAGTGALKARGAIVPPGGQRSMLIPAVAGIGVLGVGVIAVVLLGRDKDGEKHRTTSAAERPGRTTPAAGSVTIDIVTRPSGAEVRANNAMLDMTPTHVNAEPGDKLELSIRKPGFIPERRNIEVGPSNSAVSVDLVEVNQFRGVWKLPDGQLRAFERRGDQVDVFKLTSVTGERTFMTRYAFHLVDAGIGFGGEDLIPDPAAPQEPSCVVRMRVDYVYDPTRDALEQRREKVDLDFADGKCTERARHVEPAQLVRADRRPSETHELAMPVGPPIKSKRTQDEKSPKSKKDALNDLVPQSKTVEKPIGKKSKPAPKSEVPLDPKAELDKKRQLEAAKKAEASKTNAATKPTETYTSPKNATGGAQQNLSAPPNAQIVPQANAAPPQKDAVPPEVENQAQAQQVPNQAPPQQAPAQVKKAPTKSKPTSVNFDEPAQQKK